MLVLSRKPGQSIVINGNITVTITRVAGDLVGVGIDAPPEVPVHRYEIQREIRRQNEADGLPADTPVFKRPKGGAS